MRISKAEAHATVAAAAADRVPLTASDLADPVVARHIAGIHSTVGCIRLAMNHLDAAMAQGEVGTVAEKLAYAKANSTALTGQLRRLSDTVKVRRARIATAEAAVEAAAAKVAEWRDVVPGPNRAAELIAVMRERAAFGMEWEQKRLDMARRGVGAPYTVILERLGRGLPTEVSDAPPRPPVYYGGPDF